MNNSGFDHCAVKYHAPVQMRTGGAPVIPESPSNCALLTVQPACTSMRSRWQYMVMRPLPWSTKTVLAVEEIIPDRQHCALCSRLDRRAARHSYIETDMGGARFPIEEAAQSKTAGQFSFGGNDEVHVRYLARRAQWSFSCLMAAISRSARSKIGSRQFDLALVLGVMCLFGINSWD